MTRRPLIDGDDIPSDLTEETIRRVVHAFYDRIRGDDLLGPVFMSRIPADAWPAHLQTMCDFWSSMLLRTARYAGRPLSPHLRMPELEDEHFRRWLMLFRSTTREVCSPALARIFLGRALRVAHSFRLSIAFNRGADTLSVRPMSEADLV